MQGKQSQAQTAETVVRYPIHKKLRILMVSAILPLLCISVYLIMSLVSYAKAYDNIVDNMTIANGYNLNFKNELDECLYEIVINGEPIEAAVDDGLRSPYPMIAELRRDFMKLESITLDDNSRTWLDTLLRNIDTLQDRVDDINVNLQKGDRYNKNIDMLQNNIYILTELIQDNIQHYIYYQTESIQSLNAALSHRLFVFTIVISVILAVVIVVLILVESKILRSVTHSVEELGRVTHHITEGDLSVRANVTSNDELSVLGDDVNKMAASLGNMVGQIRDDEKRMRHEALRLLQEQLTPLFLYNTLDTIIWLIEGGKTEEAEDIVLSLSNFFRLVLSKGREFITVKDEEQHIRSYLEIQQVRYRDILSYEIHIDPAIYGDKILKLTLQPIVENALYHGIKEKREGGLITITGEQVGENIRLVVKDNGAGMDEEELSKIRSDISKPCKETDAGFGLANVNERIRMNFGVEYGMSVESKKGEGTTVTVIIPAVPSEQAPIPVKEA